MQWHSMHPEILATAFSNAANESGVERSRTTPIITTIPASSARGFNSATMPVIRPSFFNLSTRRRQAGALRFTLRASATFDTEASRCKARRIILSVRSRSEVDAVALLLAVRTFIAFIEILAQVL